MWLCFAGLTFRVRECDPQTELLLKTRWPEFWRYEMAPHERADATLFIQADESLRASWPAYVPTDAQTSPTDAQTSRDDNRPLRQGVEVHREGETWTFRRMDFVGTWNASGAASVRYAGELQHLNSFLRVLSSLLLAQRQGGLIHAASVQTPSGIVLLPGPSGTGKSTVASLAPRGKVLTDEISSFRLINGDAVAFPTPFWGDLLRERAAHGGPLRAIVHVKRGEFNCLRASPASSLATLMHCMISFEGMPADKQMMFKTMESLVHTVPSFVVTYNAPANPWNMLDQQLPPAREKGLHDLGALSA